jgi:hypothetical protein
LHKAKTVEEVEDVRRSWDEAMNGMDGDVDRRNYVCCLVFQAPHIHKEASSPDGRDTATDETADSFPMTDDDPDEFAKYAKPESHWRQIGVCLIREDRRVEIGRAAMGKRMTITVE